MCGPRLLMLALGVAIELVSGGELRAADGAVDAADGLLGKGPADVLGGGVFALVVSVKLLAGGKDAAACLADKLIACHFLCAPFVVLASFLALMCTRPADRVPRR